MQFPRSRLLPKTLALAAGLGLASLLPAADNLASALAFTGTLPAETQTEAGLNTLNASQRQEIDRLVAREIALARDGNVRAFAGTFTSRRKTAELEKTGLDRLTSAQKDHLDAEVAQAIAHRADAATALAYNPKREGDEPMAVAMKRKLIVHGGMSLTAGWGSNGSNFQSASAYSTFTDPQSKTSLTVAVTSSRGKGFYGYGYPGLGYGYDDAFGLGLGYPYYDDYFGGDYSWRRNARLYEKQRN